MGAKSLKDIARLGYDVLTVVIDGVTGLVTSQLGDVVKQRPVSEDNEWYYPPGYVGIPRKPDAGTAAAQVAVITRSSNGAIVGCRDARDAQIVTAVGLDYGETMVFSPAGGGYAVFRKDGTVSVGDATAASVAKGDAMSDLIDALITLAGTNCVNGSPLAGAGSFEESAQEIKARCKTTKVKLT